MQGITCTSSLVQEGRLQYDRLFMLSYPDGHFISAREHPELLRFKTALTTEGVVIIAPDKQHKLITTQTFSTFLEPTEVWGNRFLSHIASISLNRWLSEYLQHDIQLRWIGEQSTRYTKRYPTVSLSFADGYPLLLVNQASLALLQQYCHNPIDIRQFRPNLVIDHPTAFIEDHWKTIQIGSIVFDVVKSCSRCVMITYPADETIHHTDHELFSVLQNLRMDDKQEIDFGHYLIARNAGELSVGDPLTILDTQPAKMYRPAPKPLQPVAPQNKTITIDYQDQQFTGNTQQVLLEQLEAHGINIPYSCRSGSCGCCQLQLEKGDVMPLNKQAKNRHGRILSCSCIPKTDLSLR